MFKDEILKEIENKKKEWEENILKKAVDKLPERKKEFSTSSNIQINSIYTPLDLIDFSYIDQIGFPGVYPFTRGIQPNMYRGRLWTMRQYAGFGSAKETNERFKFLLSKGQTGLSVAFDLPTQMGYDSDDEKAEGEVGKVGVAIDTVEDMEELFKDIPLDKVSTSMTINSPASILLAMYIAIAEKGGIKQEQLSGTVQNDILKEYVARGTYIFPPKQSMRLVRDLIVYCSKNLPKWNSISISGYHIREAGSDAVQEIAFTFSNAIAYIEDIVRSGIDVDLFAPRISFFFNAHSNFFEEIAKFRAARRLWAKIMKERFSAKKKESTMLRFHTQTAGCTLTSQQPDNNIIRVTLQALSAVLGGTQSLHTNSRDEALALPSDETVQIALRTQQVIAYETGVTDTPDPLGGSYFIESLTNEIEERAKKYIDEIDSLGGAVKAIEKGYIQNKIQNSAYKQQKEIENKERIIVGVNEFVKDEQRKMKLLKLNPEIEREQREKLNKIKKHRTEIKIKEILDRIKKVAEGDENIMPIILEAVKNNLTIGEICGALREVFGEYKEKL